MPRRLALRLINLVWYGTALLIVLTAVIVATGRELLPQINLDNQALFQAVSERTGANIEAQGLRGEWSRLYPEFRADAVVITTGTLDLRMENIQMDIDILRSLLQKSPVIDKLVLSKATVSYRQPSTGSTPEADPAATWHFINLLLNKNIHIRNVSIDWQHNGRTRLLTVDDFRLQQTLTGKKVFLRLINEQGDEQLHAIANLQGDTLDSSKGKLYLSASDFPLQSWLPAIDTSQSAVLQSLMTQDWRANGEAWLDWEGSDTVRSTARISVVRQPSAAPLPQAIRSELSLQWLPNGARVIDIHSLSLDAANAGQAAPASPLLQDMRVSGHRREPGQWRLQTPALSLENVFSLQAYLPDGQLKQLMHSLQARGHLRNVELLWNAHKPLTERMQLKANADNVSSGAWHGVPAFTGVNGYLQSGLGYGFIDLDSKNGFSMFYPAIYREPLSFQQAAGRVQWHWQPEQHAVLVGSDHVSLSSDAGEARGHFWLHLPLADAGFHDEMYLAIGLRNSHSRYRKRFIPTILPANLLAWLEVSIGDADVPTAGFIYRGALSGKAPASRSVQFYADIRHGELQFDKAWPPLTGLDAQLLVDDGNAVIRASSGQMYDTRIEAAYVAVTQQDPGFTVGVQAQTRGPAGDGLRILRETPLHQTIGNSMDSWRIAEGTLATGLQLQIPLGDSTLPQQQDVRLSLTDARLAMDDLRLDFSNIQGDLQYHSDKGLLSSALKARLFGKEILLDLNSKKTPQALAINVNATGSIPTPEIARWSALKPLAMLQGTLDYRAELALGPFGGKPAERVGQLKIASDLRQVELPLPLPFHKPRGEKNRLAVTVDLYRDNRQDYRIDYDTLKQEKLLSGAISVRQGQLFGGEIVLMGDNAAFAIAPAPLLVRGQLSSGDLQQWLDLIAAYNQLPGVASGANIAYPEFRFSFSNAVWRDLAFPGLQLRAEHENQGWDIYFDSGTARGSARFHDDQRIPEIILSELTYYRQPTAPGQAQKPSSYAIDFSAVPSLNIRIDRLLVDDVDIGHFSGELRSGANALHLDNLTADGRGYRLRDGSGTRGSKLVWRRDADGQQSTEFHGLVHMQGAQPVLKHLGLDPYIRGENVYFYADLDWPGAPPQVDLKRVKGNLYTKGENGQYLQASPNAAMRVLGIINVTTWARRLRLDFSDLRSDGISFDEYSGKLSLDNGRMELVEPLVIQSPSSSMTLSGSAQLDKEELDLQLTATLPVGNNATWITALAGGLPAAAGVYLVSKVFDDQIKDITSLTYNITGPMADPDVEFQRIAAPPKGTLLKKILPGSAKPSAP